jgi:hypothetical protein
MNLQVLRPLICYAGGSIFLLLSHFLIALPCRADESFQSLPSDDEIQELVYSDYKVPNGFYTADFTNASPYYENTISVTPNDKRHFPPATQLCEIGRAHV